MAYGGTEEYILMMLRYLDRNRYTPIVVTSGYNYRFLPQQFVDKVDELRVPRLHTAIEQHSRLGSSIGDILNTTRLFRDTQTDIVHIHNQRPDGGRRATIAACLARVRGVIRSEHLPPSSNLKPWSRML
ncbi:MAG TPA: glycosyltransferase, partial [Roseiflexaceae bacterium]|nr:glycosyltransferase [Roseiflexaceae bacterium]